MTDEPLEQKRNLGAFVAAVLVLVCLWQAGNPPPPLAGVGGAGASPGGGVIQAPDHGRISLLDEWMGALRDLGGALERTPPAADDDPSAGQTESELPALAPREFEGYVLIDPGHGGRDGGAVGHGMVEKHVTLDLSRMLLRELERREIPARLTRDRDVGMSLMDRCAMANRGGDALFISVHVNSIAGPGASGVETFYCQPRSALVEAMNRMRHPRLREEHVEDQRSRLFAQVVQGRLVAETGARDRGIKNKPLAVIRHTEAPAILVECGFLSDANEAALLRTQAYRRKLVSGMADGIEEFLRAMEDDPHHGFVERPPDEAGDDADDDDEVEGADDGEVAAGGAGPATAA